MAAELEAIGVEGEDFHVVTKGDRTLIVPIRKSPDEPYDPDPQIRAYQMVKEGRLGGAGRGQGRKRKPRAAEKVAEAVRHKADKIIKAIDDGLDAESTRTRLDAAAMALKIERDETILQLKEEEIDLDRMGKDELVDSLIQLVSDPSIEAQLEAVIDLPPSAISEIVNTDDNEVGEGQAALGVGTAVSAETNRTNLRAFGSNGRAPASRDRGAREGARTARSNGRTAD
jgi:hypothetical protein